MQFSKSRLLLLLLACGTMLVAKQPENQILTVPVSDKIVVDGKVNKKEWENAAKIQGFSRIDNGFLMTTQKCYTFLARDAKNLYFAVKTSNDGQEAGTGTVALVSNRDGNIWNDDCVELNLSPNEQDRYVFIINSKGVIYDAQNKDKSWNSNIEVANIDQSGCWTLEGKIPLADLGDESAEKIGINVCRTWTKYSVSDAFGVRRYSNMSTKLIFSPDSPAVKEYLFTEIDNDKFKTSLEVINPQQKTLNLTWRLKSIGENSASLVPLNWVTGEIPFKLNPQGNLTCDKAYAKTAKIFYMKKFEADPEDAIKLTVKARGKGMLQPGIILYDNKYISSELAKIQPLSDEWKLYTFVYDMPENLKGRKIKTYRIRVDVKNMENLEIENIALTQNNKDIDINGDFKKHKRTGLYKEKSIKISSSKQLIDISQRLPKGKMAFEFSYTLKDNNKILYRRASRFEKGSVISPDPRPCTINKIIENSLNLRVRHYPGFKRASIELQPFNWKKNKIARAVVTLIGKDGKTIQTELKEGKLFWFESASLKEFKDGVIDGKLCLFDQKGNILYNSDKDFSFEIKSFNWENQKLGLSDKIIKPFTPMAVKGNIVETVLRRHSLGNNGLLAQVNALGENILAAPITLKMVCNGKLEKWKFDQLKFIKKQADEVQAEANGHAGNVNYKALITFDYDGFIWIKANLSSSKKTKIDSLTLSIPIKSEYCTLMHAFADRIRNNPSGYIPQGHGKVWDSKNIERRMVKGKLLIANGFTPYIWLGEETRGLCWFADCSAGFSLQSSVPQIRIYRNTSDSINLEVDIINKAVMLDKPRNFEFGLQATPVKPQPAERKNWYFSSGSEPIQGMFNIGLSIHGRGQGKASNLNSEPLNSDYSYLEYLGSIIGSGKEKSDFIEAYLNKIYPAYLKWIELNKNGHLAYAKRYMRKNETYEQFCRRFLANDIYSASRVAARSNRINTYTDPRLCDYGNEAVDYYIGEWWSPQTVSYLGVFRSTLTPSQRDFFLNIYKNILTSGKGKIGIYIDDSFLVPGDNINNGTAVLDQDGNIHSRVGILALRDLVKRTAVMMDEMKINPRTLIIHMTNSLIIPAHSFCDITYDWEMEYGSKDFQDRFSLDFIRAESTGRQIGALGAVLEGIHNVKKLPGNYSKNMIRLTRTSLALQLLHEIISNTRSHASDPQTIYKIRKIIHDFRTAEKNCMFTGYWEKSNKVKLSNKNFKCSYYDKGNKVMLAISNMGDKGTAQIYWDDKKIELVDMESKQVYTNGLIEIPKHDFKLLLMEKK
jgi:hypothetical protein